MKEPAKAYTEHSQSLEGNGSSSSESRRDVPEREGFIGLAAEASGSNRLREFRARLKRFVDIRLDDRLSTRLEASDVVQETFAEVSRHWQQFCHFSETHLFRLLRKVARGRAIDGYRRHIVSSRRSVLREVPYEHRLTDQKGHGCGQLGETIAADTSGPGEKASREEMLVRLRDAMAQLPNEDRRLLELRHLEQRSVDELARHFHTSKSVITSRHLRAIQRLRQILKSPCEWHS